ncbi:MAG: translocation/assembly module TamB domain-containing protein [Bacteriovoracales bacterium]|nr:translocation/assembly module TamB domain-containing protein [Bacteriovoracales bacterium]
MRKINKILIVFLMGIFALSFVALEVLQTKYFSGFISKRLSNTFDREIVGAISFEKAAVRFFPPGIIISGVEMDMNRIIDGISQADIFVDEIDFQFDLIDLFKNKVSFKKAIASGGIARINLSHKNEKKIDSILEEISSFRDTSLRVVKNIELKDMKVDIDRYNFYSKNIKISLHSDVILLGIDIYNLKGIEKDFVFLKGFDIDDVSADIKIRPKNVIIQNLNILSEDSSILAKAQASFGMHFPKDFEYNAELKVSSFIESIIKKNTFNSDITGELESHIKLKGRGRHFDSSGHIELARVATPFVKVLDGRIDFKKSGDDIVATSLRGFNKSGGLEVKDRFKIFNLSSKEFYPFDLNIKMSSLNLSEFFFFQEKRNHNFDITLDGEANILSDFKNIQIISKNLFSKKTHYSVGGMSVLDYREANIKNLELNIDTDLSYSSFRGTLNLDETLANISGYIGKEIDISIDFPQLNLEEALSIGTLDFSGKGMGRLKIEKSKGRDLLFKIYLNVKKSQFLGYRFGGVDANIDYLVGEKIVAIKKGALRKERSVIFVDGEVDFKNRVHLDLKFNSSRGIYKSLKDLTFPISKEIDFLPGRLDGNLSGDVRVWGYVDDVNVDGKYIGEQLNFLGESIQGISLDFSYKKSVLRINNISIRKGNGFIRGNYTFYVNRKGHSYDFIVKDIEISDFDRIDPHSFSVIGQINMSGKGEIGRRNFNGEMQFGFENVSVSGDRMPNSFGSATIKNGILNTELSIFDGDIILKSNISLNSRKKHSDFLVEVNTSKIKEMMSIFFPHNINRSDIVGRIKGISRAEFSLENMKNLDLLIRIDDFEYRSNEIRLKKNNNSNMIVIDRGKIKSDEILLEGHRAKFLMKANSSLSKGIDFNLFGNIDASILKIFDENILSSRGELYGNGMINISKYIDEMKMKFSLEGKKVGGTYSGFMAQFDGFNFFIDSESEKINFKKFKGKIGGGDLNISGNILMKIPFPIFNLKYSLDNAKIRFLRKTNVWLSSKGEVKGNKAPYSIKSSVSLINGSVFDEFSKFISKSEKKYLNPYIPKTKKKMEIDFFLIDLKLSTIRPLLIKNRLLEMSTHARADISGNIFNPVLRGQIDLVPGTGKFYFRNNDFILKKGFAKLGGNENNDILLDFTGVSKIRNYDVTLRIVGDLDNFKIELDSRPSLPEEEILSLLALGITKSSTSHLSDQDREAVTSLGLGTLILDRFRVNQELKSVFGINLSLTPEVVETEKNYFNDDSQLKDKNSTKISVNKRLTENVSIKASSTIGRDIVQKREMNINYNINKNLSLEGIYELKDEDQVEESDSLGTDVKFRIEF